jgi:hypothetical protein
VAILIDTSVLGRLANRADAAYGVAVSAIAELHRRGELLHLTPQNLVEFRNFATRPVAANGLGLAASAADGPGGEFRGGVPAAGGDAGHLPGMEGFLLKRLASLASKFMTLGSWRSATPTGGVARVDVQRGALRPARGVRPRRRGR